MSNEYEYSVEVGSAGERYLKSVAFKGEYSLPHQFRWCDLFSNMQDAAKTGATKTAIKNAVYLKENNRISDVGFYALIKSIADE